MPADLNPSVQHVVEQYLGKPPAPMTNEITILVDEDGPLEPVHELTPSLFLLLSEDESGYDLVSIPINEGIGDFLGKALQGLKGMWKWLYNNATDWISRKLPGGNARQITKLYNEDPDKARELVRNGLSKQFQGPELEKEMKVFDSKMSRQKAVKTNGLNMMARIRKNPNDKQAAQGLQAIGDAYGSIRAGGNSAQAAKQAVGSLGKVLSGHFANVLGGGHVDDHAPVQKAPKTPAQPVTPGTPVTPGAPVTQEPKDGDLVHQIDAKTGEIKSGTLKILNDPKQNLKDLKVVMLADGTSVPFGPDWKVGPPPEQKPAEQSKQEAQPTPAEAPKPETQTPPAQPEVPPGQPAAQQPPVVPPIAPPAAPPAKKNLQTNRVPQLNNRRRYNVNIVGTKTTPPQNPPIP